MFPIIGKIIIMSTKGFLANVFLNAIGKQIIVNPGDRVEGSRDPKT